MRGTCMLAKSTKIVDVSGQQNASRRMRVLDGMRGAAILIVVLSHIATLLPQKLAVSAPLGTLMQGLQNLGSAGTNLSFFLSGYLIWQLLVTHAPSFKAFFSRRFARLYPGFAVVTAIYLLACIALPARSKLPDSSWDAVVFVSTNLLMLPGIFALPILNTVTWSLSYEWLWYLLAFAVVAWSRRYRLDHAGRSLVLMGMAVATAAACAVWGGPHRMILFAMGALAWESRALDAVLSRSAAVPTGLLLLMGILLFTGLPAVDILSTAVAVCAWWSVCTYCLAAQSSWLTTVFGWRAFRLVGCISYPLYLSHGLAVHGALEVLSKWAAPTALGSSLLAVACVGASLITAWALQALLAMPGLVQNDRKPVLHAPRASLEMRD